MSQRKLPSTSISAYHQAVPHMATAHQEKIIKALEVLGSATGDELADYLTMEKVQVMRRMVDLERAQKVYKPGTKRLTKSGRNAFVYCLVGGLKTDNEIKAAEKSLPGKTVSDYSRELIPKPELIQLELKLPETC